jgi:hypothetical protein
MVRTYGTNTVDTGEKLENPMAVDLRQPHAPAESTPTTPHTAAVSTRQRLQLI